MAVRFTRGGLQSFDPSRTGREVLTRKPKAVILGRVDRGSGRNGSFIKKDPVVTRTNTSVIIDGVGFSVRPDLQAEFIKQRTGGKGSSAQAAIKSAEAKVRLDKYSQEIQGRVSRQNMNRIAALRSNIQSKGGRTDTRLSRDVKTGDKLKIENTFIGTKGERVFKVTNLTKGFTTYKTFEKPNGGRVRQTSTFVISQPKFQKSVTITSSKQKGRLNVRFPNGQKTTIKSTGKVVVGASFAGKKYTFWDGQLVTDKEDLKKIDAYIAQKGEKTLKQGVINLIEKLEKENEKNATYLNKQSSNAQKEYANYLSVKDDPKALAEYKKSLRTNKQRYNLLLKDLAAGSRWVLGVGAKSTLELGVGGSELVKNLYKNPTATIAALPPAIWEGMKKDYAKVISGKGLQTAEVIIQYYTIGKVLGLASRPVMKGLKLGYRLSGKQLSKLTKRITSSARYRASDFAKVLAKNKQIVKQASKTIKSIDSKKSYLKNYKNYANKLKKIEYLGSNADYIQAKSAMEAMTKAIAKLRVKRYIKNLKKSGIHLDKRRIAELFKTSQRRYLEILKQQSGYKEIQVLIRMNKPQRVTYYKLSQPLQLRLQAEIALKQLINTKLIKIIKKISSKIKQSKVLRKVKKVKKKIKRALDPRVRARKAKIKKLTKASEKRYKLSLRYQMDKVRPIRKTTIKSFQKTQTIAQGNKIIDKLFDELGRRNRIDITSVKFRQIKNLLKQRLKKAIKTNNRQEIRNFANKIQNLIDNMNKKSSQPNVRFAEIIKVKGKRPVKTIKTIKDFQTSTPKGSYVEVKSGQTVLLQRVKTKIRTQTKQISKTKLKILSVQKKSISLAPLLKFLQDSLTIVAIKQALKFKSKGKFQVKTLSLSAVLGKDITTYKIIEPLTKVNVKLAILQAVRQKVRIPKPSKTITKLKEKPGEDKPKPIPFALKGRVGKKKRKVKRKQGYTSSSKIRKKVKRLNEIPLTKSRALDFLAYNLDKTKSFKGRTTKSLKRIIPSLLHRQLKSVPKGYFERNRKKFTLRRLRKGRETYEVIEKKKYRKDKPIERKNIKKKIHRKRNHKRKIIKRKRTFKRKKK